MSKLNLLVLCCAAAVATGCAYIAVHTAPAKVASTVRKPESLKADEVFWQTLHDGKYEEIASALKAVTAAYLADPADDISAAHVGWLHIWRVSESARSASSDATITDDIVLARKYFEEAVKLHPGEARYLGFLASAKLAEGSVHKDERITRDGYFTMMDAVDAWPEFNLFTAGYVMSGQAADSDNFRKALQWQWKNLDVCIGERLDRGNPDFRQYMQLATQAGPKRVCWNSWIAPHNLEGFFMNMGDMLVKSGDWKTAQKIYANAQLSPGYEQWKYRAELETRLRNAESNVAVFNKRRPTREEPRIMNASAHSCMACHQN